MSAPEDHFGPGVAERYDADYAELSTPEAVGPMVDVLAGLAGNGRALELAIGTGRVALPLAARGIGVAGIELSEAMVGELRAKPGGEAIDVAIGDMATTRVDGPFRLVYLVFNTINNLTTQDAQVACFANAAAHLEPGGVFVIEVGVPQIRSVAPGERFHVFSGPGDWGIDEFDFATQRFTGHYPPSQRTIGFRYVWPSELDLMARLTGMTLRERSEDWDGAPFTGESPRHVSVWTKDAQG